MNVPPEIKVEGVYKHKHLPISFPENISGFKRFSITEHSDDEKSVSIGYNLRAENKYIIFTVYLTSDSLLNLYPGDTLKQVIIANRTSIEYVYDRVEVISDEESKFKDVYPGRKIIFELKDPRKSFMSNSELHVFKVNDWIIKYRITYPEIQRLIVQQDIADIIGEIESGYSM